MYFSEVEATVASAERDTMDEAKRLAKKRRSNGDSNTETQATKRHKCGDEGVNNEDGAVGGEIDEPSDQNEESDSVEESDREAEGEGMLAATCTVL